MGALRALFFLLLLLWYCLAAYWYVCHLKQNECNSLQSFLGNNQAIETPIAVAPPLLIRDGNQTIVESEDNFAFKQSTAEIVNNPAAEAHISAIAQYMKQNPTRQVRIVGNHAPSETNETNKPNLGLARAQAVKDKLVAKGLPQERIFVNTKQNPDLAIQDDQVLGGIDFEFKRGVNRTPPANKAAFLRDGRDTILNVTENFQFQLSSPNPVIAPSLQEGLQSLSDYLKTKPNRQLSIVGSAAPHEQNNTGMASLGLARAEAVRHQLIATGADSTQLATGARIDKTIAPNQSPFTGGINFYIRNNPQASTPPDTSNAQPVPATQEPAIVIRDGKDTVMTIQEPILFKKSSPNVPIPPDLRKNLNSLAGYISKNPDRELEIIASYGAEEENKTNFSDLGTARAEKLKQAMMGNNPHKDRVAAKGRLDPSAKYGPDDSFQGDMEFKIKVTDKLAKKLEDNLRPLYFKSSSFDLDMGEDLQKYFKDIKTYLEQDTKKKVVLTGHTDGSGDAALNKKLGLDRAEKVKKLLVNLNIDANRIVTKSEGEDKPIASNDTEEGKKKNRRVEMVIK